MTLVTVYCLATPGKRPINVCHDGDGPHIQVSQRVCETYDTEAEAQARHDYLRICPTTARRASTLTIKLFSEVTF